jgi:hypothetical protein
MWAHCPPLPSQPFADFEIDDPENGQKWGYNEVSNTVVSSFQANPSRTATFTAPCTLAYALNLTALLVDPYDEHGVITAAIDSVWSVQIRTRWYDPAVSGENGWRTMIGAGYNPTGDHRFLYYEVALRKDNADIEVKSSPGWDEGILNISIGRFEGTVFAHVSATGHVAGQSAPAFGSQSVSLQSSATDPRSDDDGAPYFALTGFGCVTVESAAYRLEPFHSSELYVPEATETKLARAGDRIASLRSRCLNTHIAALADGNVPLFPRVDLAGHGEFSEAAIAKSYPGCVAGQPDENVAYSGNGYSNVAFTESQNDTLKNITLECGYITWDQVGVREDTGEPLVRPVRASFSLTAAAGRHGNNEYAGIYEAANPHTGRGGIPIGIVRNIDYYTQTAISLYFYAGYKQAAAWVTFTVYEDVSDWQASTFEGAGVSLRMEIAVDTMLLRVSYDPDGTEHYGPGFLSGRTTTPQYDQFERTHYTKTLNESQMQSFFDGTPVVITVANQYGENDPDPPDQVFGYPCSLTAEAYLQPSRITITAGA